jgi:hypothetical protein
MGLVYLTRVGWRGRPQSAVWRNRVLLWLGDGPAKPALSARAVRRKKQHLLAGHNSRPVLWWGRLWWARSKSFIVIGSVEAWPCMTG